MIQKEDCTFRVKLVVDSKVLEIKVDECVKFKKITTQKNEDVKSEVKASSQTEDLIKNIMNYVKKIDPDQVTKTVTSIQKVLELIGSFGAGSASTALAKKSTGDPLFDKRFDEWY